MIFCRCKVFQYLVVLPLLERTTLLSYEMKCRTCCFVTETPLLLVGLTMNQERLRYIIVLIPLLAFLLPVYFRFATRSIFQIT